MRNFTAGCQMICFFMGGRFHKKTRLVASFIVIYGLKEIANHKRETSINAVVIIVFKTSAHPFCEVHIAS